MSSVDKDVSPKRMTVFKDDTVKALSYHRLTFPQERREATVLI